MFWTMFGASALATILFSGKAEQPKDYSYDFRTVNDKLDKINSKIDSVIDTQKFMRARSCLENFSPLLLEGIKLSYKHHTAQDIMSAAKEGFNTLCATACADENNFKEARKIFSETYGNETWVTTKFKNEIDEWTKKIEEREEEYKQLKPIYDEINLKVNDIFQTLVYKKPMKKMFFITMIDKKQIKNLIDEFFKLINDAPDISKEYGTYMNENPDKWISIDLTAGYDLSLHDIWNNAYYAQWKQSFSVGGLIIDGKLFANVYDYIKYKGITIDDIAKYDNEVKIRDVFGHSLYCGKEYLFDYIRKLK